MTESAAARFDRDWLRQRDDRKARGYDQQATARKNRRYVNRVSGVAAYTLVPANTVAPAITGTAQQGQTLTTTNGTWTNSPTFARKWYANGVEISGATGTTYVVQVGDVGKKIHVVVTASKTDYPDFVATSNETATVIAA